MIISRYLKASPDLAAVTQHAERLLALQHLFEVIAPPALAQYCRVANFKQGKLVLHAANTLVAAKLRRVVPRLSDDFSSRGWQVTAIQVAVQDRTEALTAANSRVSAPARLDSAARAGLAAFADTVGDERLRAAVRRLLES